MKNTICPICEEGKLIETTKKILLEFKNPGNLVVGTKLLQCNNCGEDFLNEDQSKTFSKKADKLHDSMEYSRKLKIKEGDLLLL